MVADPTRDVNEMAQRLMTPGFERTGPAAAELSDPLVDTPMVVTLDQLQAYDLNPRLTRNPRYEEIKASIRERGLDAPPAITRRPGAPVYMIRNGGNTRLGILRELWSETKEERFFRIPCLFRPWSERGEIVALTGHLAENELHGALTFIERALGVEKARELYEAESAGALSQSELARRLAADGYPVSQPHISRMQDAVRYLLPAIPSVLYAGLGRPMAERLIALHKTGQRLWDERVANSALGTDFATVYQEVLSGFDVNIDVFSFHRVQDELIGQMSQVLQLNYDALALEFDSNSHRLPTPTGQSAAAPFHASPVEPARHTNAQAHDRHAASSATGTFDANMTASVVTPVADPPLRSPASRDAESATGGTERAQQITISPAVTTERLETVQQLIADHTGEPHPSFDANAVQSIPVRAGGLYPISDIWSIDVGIDTPEALRTHAAQLALEIAAEVDAADRIEVVDEGIGFRCAAGDAPTLMLLRAFTPIASTAPAEASHPAVRSGQLGPLLIGTPSTPPISRLSDHSLVKLFRLIRLARRLHEPAN